MRYKIVFQGTYPRDFLLDGDYASEAEIHPAATNFYKEEAGDEDCGWKVVPVPEKKLGEVSDEWVRDFLSKYRKLNWPNEPETKRDMEVGFAVKSFRAGIAGGYEPDGVRWGLKNGYQHTKVRFRLRDDDKGDVWFRFVIHSNSIALGDDEHREICRVMREVVAELEKDFPVIGER